MPTPHDDLGGYPTDAIATAATPDPEPDADPRPAYFPAPVAPPVAPRAGMPPVPPPPGALTYTAPGYAAPDHPFAGNPGSVPTSVYAYPVEAPPRSSGLATAALVLGILSIVFLWVPLLGIVAGIIAVVLGNVARTRGQRKGFAIAGIVTGGVGIFVSVMAWIIAFAVMMSIMNAPEGTAEADAPAAVEESSGSRTEPDESGAMDEPAVTDEFAALDAASFGALVADPVAAYGKTYVMYGEIQYLDETTGPCAALIAVDDAHHTSWEGYATTAWLVAESGGTDCPEFQGLASLSHIKANVTVVGTQTTEFDDGTIENVLTLALRDAEVLEPLP